MTRDCVLSVRLTTKQKKRLSRLARRWGRKPSDAGALAIEEVLRQEEFAGIEFRSTPTGRLAYVAGTRTPVWLVSAMVRDCQGKLAKAAKLLKWPEERVQTALDYAEAFPGEINGLIEEAAETDFETLRRKLPMLETSGSGLNGKTRDASLPA
jgi:hypothetical protein